jgi:hypothetical protein
MVGGRDHFCLTRHLAGSREAKTQRITSQFITMAVPAFNEGDRVFSKFRHLSVRASVGTVAPALVVVGTLLGVGACSGTAATATSAAGGGQGGSARASQGATPPAATPQDGLAKGMSLPMAAYMETYPQRSTIDAAIGRLVHNCMARFGFSYVPPVTGGNPASSYDDTNMARRYGISDPVQAAQFGYGLGDDSYTPPPAPRMTDAEVAVFSGHVALRPGAALAPPLYNGIAIPKDGCQRESLNKVGGVIDTSLPGQLDSQSLDTSQSDPQVQNALHRWSACMAAKGYTVDTPYNADKLAPGGGSAGASSAEIAVALADISCKKSVDLVGIWFKTETQVQRQLIEKNQLALSEVRDRLSAAVKAATAVTG